MKFDNARTRGRQLLPRLVFLATAALWSSGAAYGAEQSEEAEEQDAAEAEAEAEADTGPQEAEVPPAVQRVLDYQMPKLSCGRNPSVGVQDPNTPASERERKAMRYKKCSTSYREQLQADQQRLNEVTQSPVPSEYAEEITAKLTELAQRIASLSAG